VRLVIEYPQFCWTLADAVKFRHPLKLDGDEQCLALHSNILRFHIASPKKRVTQTISLTEVEKQRRLIRQELNKLSPQNFVQVIDTLTTHENFAASDGQFLTMLAAELYESAKSQPLFSDMYSLFVEQITQVLNNDEFRLISDKFVNCLGELVFSLFDPAHDFSGLIDTHLTHASFLGCLAARSRLARFNVEFVFEGAVRLLQTPIDQVKLEVCGKLVVPCGHLIDARFHEQAERLIFTPFAAFSKDKSLPGNIRYFLMDILQARQRNWDIASLLNQINIPDRRPAAAPRSVQRPVRQEPVRIAAGANPFANLRSSDESEDEYGGDEEEDAQFDARGMIREYIFDKTISPAWDTRRTADLLLAIAEYPEIDVPRAAGIFRALYERDQFMMQDVQGYVRNLVVECRGDQIRDAFPMALANCGTILGHLVGINALTVDDFEAIFAGIYDFAAVANFLDQMVELKKLSNVSESDFWMSYRWRPDDGVLHLEIMERLVKKWPEGELLQLFPIYDNLMLVMECVRDEADRKLPFEEFARTIDEEIPEDVKATSGFVLGVVELLIKSDFEPKKDVCVKLLRGCLPKQTEIAAWVDFYGQLQNWQPEQIKWWQNRIADAG
jgi:hypothetical protein